MSRRFEQDRTGFRLCSDTHVFSQYEMFLVWVCVWMAVLHMLGMASSSGSKLSMQEFMQEPPGAGFGSMEARVPIHDNFLLNRSLHVN